MTATIDYYYSHISPWAFLGHDAFVALAKKFGAQVTYKPVNLGQVFPESGGLPLAKRHPSRQALRLVELQRWREKRDLPLKLRPAHFPTDPTLSDCVGIVLAARGGDIAGFSQRAMRACWVLDQDIADEQVIAGILDNIGENSGEVLAEARSDATRAVYVANAQGALAAGVFGSPTYMLNGEPFFGQDRLDLLEDALTSGRGPYSAD